VRRRLLLGGGLFIATDATVHGQQSVKGPTIGLLYTSTPLLGKARVDAFVRRLGELGWVDGRNITIDLRWGEGSADRVDEALSEFVRRNVDVIVINGDVQVRTAKGKTATIPIVISSAADPVGTGLVASLARPGGNVTGLSLALTDTAGKRLELLREAIPSLRRVAILGNFGNPTIALEFEAVQAAARTLGLETIRTEIRKADDIAPAIEALKGQADGLYICVDPLVGTSGKRINELAIAARLPTMHSFRELVDAGGLIGYGPDVPDMFRRAADFVDRILRGAKPGDIPVEQPTKFVLVVNMKTAKALGITIPPTILVHADEVIE
jgi:putative ABC transport system substrate-binding protein